MKDFYVVIPARFSSSRLPGKPLKMIAGKTMVEHVYRQAQLSRAHAVFVATDDERIAEVVSSFGGQPLMTRPDHVSGTDRLQEAAAQLGLADDQIIVNVQGDEPLIPPEVIDQVASNLSSNVNASAATLCEPINNPEDFVNPNVVKVVANRQGLASYFSRAPIPWPRDAFATAGQQMPQGHPAKRHIGIYAYRVSVLNQFVSWPAAPTETIESLEQLRLLYQGAVMHVDEACALVPGGVDTDADLQKVRRLLGDSASE